MKRKIIYGCESRGDGNRPYLIRWELFNLFGDKLVGYLHKFLRSDAEEHHDHPWAFVSIIIWRGYYEETPCPKCKGTGRNIAEQDTKGKLLFSAYGEAHKVCGQVRCSLCDGPGYLRHRKWPGMVLVRPATTRHRVVLVNERPAFTIVVRGKYVREWGFYTHSGRWQRWKEYFQERGC